MIKIYVDLLQQSIIFLIRRTSRGAVTLSIKPAIKNENMSNKELAEELHKSINRKFEKTKVYSRFVDNIWDGDLADIQLISKFNKGTCFFIDIFSKHTWVIPLKDKKVLQLPMLSKKL